MLHGLFKVRFFARYRELAGKTGVEMEIEPGTTVAMFKDKIMASLPKTKDWTSSIAIAVNNDLADLDLELNEGDEVALLPPFGGG